MLIAIGCDVVDHQLTRDLGWSSNTLIRSRVFSPKELELSSSTDSDLFMSGRFAGKEAILKCLGIGMRDGIALSELQILKDESGKPVICIEGEAASIAQALGIITWQISISHTSNFSTAFVVAEG